MTPDPPPEPSPIELEPLSLRKDSRYAPTEIRQAGLPPSVLNDGPIPSRPLHLCPQCNYILTGLTSRRCPECGEPFTLQDARLHGLEHADDMQRAFSVEKWTRIKFYLGLALLPLSIWLQNFSTASIAGWFGFRTTFRGLLMFVFMVPLAMGVTAWRIEKDRTWPDAVWLAGLIAAAFGIFLALL